MVSVENSPTQPLFKMAMFIPIIMVVVAVKRKRAKTLIPQMSISETQASLLEEIGSSLDNGLTRDEASKRRQEDGSFNVVSPPVDCPAWICCLLPCIKSIPSMKAFRQIQPEDAEVLREGKWIRYDAASLVRGDIIKLEEGDIVPADCVILTMEEDEMLVDVKTVTGEDKPRSIKILDGFAPPIKLFYGGLVLQGSGQAVVTATGPATLLAKLIQQKKFPPQENILEANDIIDDVDAGISLITHTDEHIV